MKKWIKGVLSHFFFEAMPTINDAVFSSPDAIWFVFAAFYR
jgi:hypothetical protein